MAIVGVPFWWPAVPTPGSSDVVVQLGAAASFAPKVHGGSPAAVPRWSSGGLPVAAAGGMSVEAVLAAVDTTAGGLSQVQATARAAVAGPNAVRTHRVRAWTVLGRQRRSALLVKRVFFADPADRLPLPRRRNRSSSHQLQRRVSRFSYHGPRRD